MTPYRFGPYQVLEEIGRGGLAVVYRAEGESGRRVALKVLEVGGSETRLRRFHREVEIARRLSHPGIVPVLDAGTEGGHCWLAMEFVEGGTLEEALALLAERDGAGPAAELAHRLAEASPELLARCVEDSTRYAEDPHRRPGLAARAALLDRLLPDRPEIAALRHRIAELGEGGR